MKDFRPEELKFLDKSSASNFLSLVKDLRINNCSLVIGAGVSTSAGLPTWDGLLERISHTYFYHWLFDVASDKATHEKPPSNVSVAFMQMYDLYLLEKEGAVFNMSEINVENVEVIVDGVKQRAGILDDYLEIQRKLEKLRKDMMDELLNGIKKYGPLLVAQMIKNQVREKDWNYLIRKSLYNQYDDQIKEIGTSELLTELGALTKNADIKSIITFNYDDLLYHTLKKQQQDFKNIYDGSLKSDYKRRIFYPHGYIPILGGVKTDIVLSEEDYQKVGFRYDDWSNMIQSTIYNSTVGIFVGLSMTDPNLRRILKACSSTSVHNHYALLPASANQDESAESMLEAMVDVDLMRLGVKVIRVPLCDEGDRFRNLPHTLKLLSKFLTDGI